jgi:hypothetical protein
VKKGIMARQDAPLVTSPKPPKKKPVEEEDSDEDSDEDDEYGELFYLFLVGR